MTDLELETKIKSLVGQERLIINELLIHINLAEDRKLPLRRGFQSTFDWIVRELGYSTAAAHRRLEAARLLRVVPDIENKLEAGSVNLTTLAKARVAMRAQEKATGQKFSVKRQTEVVAAIENKSTDEVERALFGLLPDAATASRRERTKPIDDTNVICSIVLTKQAQDDLAWVRDFHSHSVPNGSNGEIVARALRAFREANSKSKAQTKIRKSQQQSCTYRDPETGRTCGATWQIEGDHIVPRAMNGSDAADNLRPLCRKHNHLMSEIILGPLWANAWRMTHQDSAAEMAD